MSTGLFAAIFAAAACSLSPPVADFTTSSDGGPVPHEISFTPVEESEDVTFLWEFGDGATSTDRTPTHTYQDARDFTVRLTASRGSSTALSERQVSLEPGEAGWITVEPSRVVLESGERQQFQASAFDALGNPVPDAPFVWTSEESVGEVLDDGTFIAGPDVGVHTDAVTVEYERLGETASLELPVEIVYGPLHFLNIEPPTINLRVNSRVDIDVIATDRQGHVLPEPDVEWTVTRGGVDAVLAGGEFRAGRLPTESEQTLVEVSVSVGQDTLTRTIPGNITTGILDRVDVTATPDEAAVGTPVMLTAQAFDRFGNELDLESVEWQLVDDSYGEVTAEGVFTPAGAAVSATGPLLMAIGELERVRSHTEVEVDILPGVATEIFLTPLTDSIPVGASNPFQAAVLDEFGNVIDGVDIFWSSDGGGTVSSGIFTAGFETGEFPGAVIATVPAGAAGNLSELTASADVTIRDRSSDLLAIEVSSAVDAGILLIDLENADILSLSDELDVDAGIELAPAWWPDGSRLAYASNVTGTLQVYDIDIETGNIRQLIDIPEGSTMPAISPEGTKIAFVVTTEPNWQVHVADLPQPDDQGNIEPLTLEDTTKLSDDDEVLHLLPWWSPDGSQIIFTNSRSASDVDISVVAADGSWPPGLLGRAGLSAFGWSDDGDFVLAVDNDSGGDQSLVVLDSETGEIVGFIPMPFQAYLAAWAPDNSEAAVVDRVTGALWLLDADGSSLRQAIDSSFVPRRVAWRPVPIDAAAVLAEREAQSEQ